MSTTDNVPPRDAVLTMFNGLTRAQQEEVLAKLYPGQNVLSPPVHQALRHEPRILDLENGASATTATLRTHTTRLNDHSVRILALEARPRQVETHPVVGGIGLGLMILGAVAIISGIAKAAVDPV